MNREEIKNLLPHREPMLLVDDAFVQEDNSAVGHYTVRGDEWFLQGHFPGNPVVPGVVLCEMLGQTCCVLVSEMVKGKKTLFTGMDKVRFKQQVTPGDTLTFECSMTGNRGPFYFAKGKGFVNGKLAVSAELSFALI